MNSDTINEGYAALRSAIGSAGLSPNAGIYLVHLFDKFHDLGIKTTGYPDALGCKTIVREFTKSQTIGKSGLLGVGNWNCLFSMMPIMCSEYACFGYKDAYVEQHKIWADAAGDPSTQKIMAGFMAVQDLGVPATYATTFWPIPSASGSGAGTTVPAGVDVYSDSPLDDEYNITGLQSQYRIISKGFEVRNTTAPFYRQGSCICYRIESNFDRELIQALAVPTDYTGWGFPIYPKLFQVVSCPIRDPRTIFTSQRTAKKWLAEEGAYVMAVMDPNLSVDFQHSARGYPTIFCNQMSNDITMNAWYGNGIGSNLGGGNNAVYKYPKFTAGTNSMSQMPPGNMVDTFQTSCALFEGLSDQTTLDFTTKVLVESVPDVADPQIVDADQSTPYDPRAIELSKHVTKDIPAGVPVRFNALGEWFETLMNFLAEVAPMVGGPIGALFGAPGVGTTIGTSVAAGATSLAQFNKKRRIEDVV